MVSAHGASGEASGRRFQTGKPLDALTTALDLGVTFVDTADVYGDGRSEKLIAQALRGRSGPHPFIATKAGKRLPAQVTSGYTLENLWEWVKRSRDYLEVDILDLVQLHCRRLISTISRPFLTRLTGCRTKSLSGTMA